MHIFKKVVLLITIPTTLFVLFSCFGNESRNNRVETQIIRASEKDAVQLLDGPFKQNAVFYQPVRHKTANVSEYPVSNKNISAYTADCFEWALLNLFPGQSVHDTIIFQTAPDRKLYRRTNLAQINPDELNAQAHRKENTYFYNDNEIYVFQYLASVFKPERKNLTIIQETDFPETQQSVFTLHCKYPLKFTLNIRQPYWCRKNFEIRVNGKKQGIQSQPGSFTALSRMWKEGDKVEVKMPFSLQTEMIKGYRNRMAILNGPMVLACTPDSVSDRHIVSPRKVPVILSETTNPVSWVIPVEGKVNTFKTVGVGYPDDRTLKPIYMFKNRDHTFLWDIFSEADRENLSSQNFSKLFTLH